MRRALVMAVVVLCSFVVHAAETPVVPVETKEQKDQRMKWFREARFGMFIHNQVKGTQVSAMPFLELLHLLSERKQNA